MKLKKCPNCSSYSLKENCYKCESKTKDAHYKFIKIKDAPKSTLEFFKK
jgi:recombinational DNA repair protein RecR